MDKLFNKKIKILLSNLCCSACKNEFSEESFSIETREKGLLSGNLTCAYCGKNFGKIFIGISGDSLKTEPVEVKDGPEAIDYDDVIDAHLFIKELDETWQKHLP